MEFDIINFGGILIKMPINDNDFLNHLQPVIDYDNEIEEDQERAQRWLEMEQYLQTLNDGNNFGSPQY